MYTCIYIYTYVYIYVYINPIPVSSSRWHSKKELPPVDFQHFEAAFARFRGAREVPKISAAQNRRTGELEALETHETRI